MATTVESLRKSIGKKKPSRAFAWLADLLCQNGDLDGALQCAQEGILHFPDSEEGLLVLSKIWMLKEDFDQVIEACESVLLKNPYCLSALRRLGDAYDKKGDEEHRNHYYQLLHDLDPLDAFWSEEYAPKITESLMDTPVAAAAAEPSLDAILKDAPPLNLPEDVPLKEESLNLPVEPQESDAPKAGGIFEKSLENEPATEIRQEPEVAAENSKPAEEDPFSSLSSLLPANDEHDDEVSFGDLEHSLDDALAGFAPTNTDKDQFPTDEIDGSDISSALSGIFGTAETEESSLAEATNDPLKESHPVEEPVKDDKPQSLSDAFDDIFGEDELPEEFVPSAQSESPSAESGDPSAASDTAATPSLESSVESSFDSLFGNESDALPTEDLTLPAEPASTPSESSTASDTAATPSLESSVESSFDSLFGNESDALEEDPTTSTRTLAEIYFEQGVYDESIKIYKDLIRKSPDDASLQTRLEEIEKIRHEKLNG